MAGAVMILRPHPRAARPMSAKAVGPAAARRLSLLTVVLLCSLFVLCRWAASLGLVGLGLGLGGGLAGAAREVLAGAAAGVVGLTLVYPLDTAKTRLQTSGPGVYDGLLDVLSKMAHKSGIGSLYRGVLSPAMGMGFIFGTSFGVHNVVLGVCGALHLNAQLALLAASLASGIISSIPRCAFERVKSVMQVSEGAGGTARHASSLRCAAWIVREEGVAGLFKGLYATIFREGPQQLAYFPTYRLTRWALQHPLAEEILPLPLHMQVVLAGACAGVVSWLPPFYFVDVVKSRMETAPADTYLGFLDCARKVYTKEGPRYFRRGLPAALARAALLHATIFVVHDFLTKPH